MSRKLMALILFLFVICIPVLPVSAFDHIDQGSNTIDEIMEYIYNHHLSRPDLDVLTEGAINGMLDTLGDSYTEYLSPDRLNQFIGSLDREFTGIGVELGSNSSYPMVINVMADSPALKAGLKPGDLIIRVDGENTAGRTLWKVVEKIRGVQGSQVKLTIRRSGRHDFDVLIERAAIAGPACEWQVLRDNVGYISLHTFGNRTAEEFSSALRKMREKQVKGLILDLRDDPGGYLQAAVEIAGNFLPAGDLVVTTVDRDGEKEAYYTAGGVKRWDLPVVVLINESTASAAEVLGGALQDYGAATLVGTRSYGKGVVQAIVSLQSGGALKMTVARYLTPKGRSIDRQGLTPDRLLSTPEIQLVAARQMLVPSDKQQVVFDLEGGSIFLNTEKIEKYFSPLTKDERVYLPLRFTLEALGYAVEWQQAGGCILVKGRGKELLLPLSKGDITNNFMKSGNALLVREGRTYLAAETLNLLDIKVLQRDAKIILEV